jgi:hypothetical protein
LILRRTVKILIVLVVLAAVVVGVGTLVLRSDWLGARILAAASERLGLDLRARSFSVGWGGDATLDTVSVRMPLRDEVVFRADRVELGLGALPWLILRRSIPVHSVELDHPTVFLRRSEEGRWNAQEVWTRVQASLQAESGQGRPLLLPQVVVREGQVQIAQSGAGTQTVGPIALEAGPKGPLLWAFDLRVSSLGSVKGQVVEGPDWAHEIRFQVQDIGPLVRNVFRQDLTPIRATGRWKGAIAHNSLSGEVRLDECKIARTSLQGTARIEAARDHVALSPRSLTVSEPNLGGEPISIADGTVAVSRTRIALASLAARMGVVGARIDGGWELDARRGEFSGSWVAAGPNSSVSSSGTYRFSLKSPQEGRKEAQATVVAQAQTPLGGWHAGINISGSGADWQQSQWQVQAPTLSWSRGQRQVEVTEAGARIALHWPEVRLESLSVPQAKQVQAEARLDARTRRWSARLAVEGLHELALGADGLDLRLAAEGDDKMTRVSELRVGAGDRVLTARGGLSLAGRELQDVHLSAAWPAGTAAAGSGSSPPGAVSPTPAGRWCLEADVTGQALPVALEAEATLTGQNVALGKQQVQRVRIPVDIRMDAKQVEVTTQPFDLLGGQWQGLGHYEFSGRETGIRIMVADLSLAAVARLVGLSLPAQGRAQAEVKLQMPGLELQKAVATGRWSAQNVHLPPLAAQRAQGFLRIANGLVQLDRIRLEQQTGLARVQMELPLDNPQVISLELDARGWPVQVADRPVTLIVDGQVKLQTNLAQKTAVGDAQLAGRIVWQDKDLANVRMATRIQGQILDVREFHAQALSGSADGTATIPLNHWTDSVARVQWQGVRPQQLQVWLPSLERIQGTLSGMLAVEPTRGKESGQQSGVRDPGSGGTGLTPETRSLIPGVAARPLGPMRFVLETDLADGRFGPAEIRSGRITGYLGRARLLIEDADFDVLGGRLETRARVSNHGGKYYGAIVADFNNLSLDPLVHVFDPNAGSHVGRLSGTAAVLPAFGRPIALTGQGRINLTQSDLAGNGVVRTLYDTLSLHFGAQEPTGTGEIRFSLEGPAVILSSIQYFNRGVEIRGSATIRNVNLGGDSPIEGYAVGSTHILKGLKLPGVGALDRWLDILQTGAASVKIGGVVDQVQVRVVPLPEVLGPFRRLLWAQLRE